MTFISILKFIALILIIIAVVDVLLSIYSMFYSRYLDRKYLKRNKPFKVYIKEFNQYLIIGSLFDKNRKMSK